MVISGDGGFMFHATEIATAVQYQLPLIICVFNDSGYGVLRGLQSNQFEGRYGDTDLGFVDFAKTAQSMGMFGSNVTSLEGFNEAFTQALVREEPCLINIDMRSLIPMQGSIMPKPAL